MKEQLYTIPLNDAVNANDECPFCYIERNVEQDLLDYVLGSGSSYMEADMRAITDAETHLETAGYLKPITCRYAVRWIKNSDPSVPARSHLWIS